METKSKTCLATCSVITDPTEWRHYKMLNEVYTSVEEGMFNTETKSGRPEIFLRPKESVNVPFKFLTFKGDHSVSPQVGADILMMQNSPFMCTKWKSLQSLHCFCFYFVFLTCES